MISLVLYMAAFLYSVMMIKVKENIEKTTRLTWGEKNINYGLEWELLNLLVCFFPIIIIYTIRAENVGIDWERYMQVYNYLRDKPWDKCFDFYMEPAYTFLNILVARWLKNVWGIALLCVIIMYGNLLYTLRLNKKEIIPALAVFIYFMTGFTFSCNVIRQAIALMVILSGLKCIEEKKMWKYCLVVFLAALFHTSALFCILFYFISFDKIRKHKIGFRVCCIVMGLVMVFLFKYVIIMLQSLGIYTGYLFQSFQLSGLRCLLYLIPEMILLFLIEKKAKLRNDDPTIMYSNIFMLQFPLQLLGVYNDVLQRMSLYPAMARVICFPLLLKKIKSKKERQFYTVLVVVWYFVYYLVMGYFLNGNGTYPFKTIFD